MCNKCLDKVRRVEIVNFELKADSLFKKIENNPDSYKDDIELTHLLDKLGKFVDKYRK